ncbi:hypothetical protein [Mucilaginibacter segetis]|uniref:Outer membrane protein beta-barrel domain-containing protein n=1 Tax=Mucilaginibacter segetis TaxID=2793071 RepID=A0A934PN79_9SPHI|nr:hypothetical protein [Mucilaginibacter segetis]MBK0377674.1 hypothetical protein [Mucilaginibacter segetis]
MKLFYTLLFAVSLLPAFCYGQRNFQPGYVVKFNSDTLKGTIDYREWDSNPDEITFKTTDGNINKFTPKDIEFFEITGYEYYRTYTGNISRDETNENRIETGRDTSYTTESVFLRIIQKGKIITLYTYRDGIKLRFFYSTPDNPQPQELIYRVYYNNDKVNPYTGSGRTVNENIYVQQLSGVALKAGVMDDKLQGIMEYAAYNKSNLLKIVTKMNGYTKEQFSNISGEKKKGFNLYGGLGINALHTEPHGNYKAAGGMPYTSFLPRVTLGLNTFVNPNTQKLLFTTEVSLNMGKYKSVYNNKVYPYLGINYGFDQFIVSLSPQVSYNFYNSENFKFFATIGWDLSYCTYYNKRYVGQDDVKVNYGLPLFYFHNWTNSAMFKGGFLISKRIQVYAEYVKGEYITYDPYFNLTQSEFKTGVNYFFE